MNFRCRLDSARRSGPRVGGNLRTARDAIEAPCAQPAAATDEPGDVRAGIGFAAPMAYSRRHASVRRGRL